MFRNRNMILVSLVMMVGGAGRDVGVNLAYLGPHMAHDLGLSLTMVGVAITVMQVGGVVGPIGFGYVSDRYVAHASHPGIPRAIEHRHTVARLPG